MRSTGAQSVFPQHSWGYHSWQAAAEDITVAARSANVIELRFMHGLRDALAQLPLRRYALIALAQLIGR
jgi:hypothetical protein